MRRAATMARMSGTSSSAAIISARLPSVRYWHQKDRHRHTDKQTVGQRETRQKAASASVVAVVASMSWSKEIVTFQTQTDIRMDRQTEN